MGRIRTQLVKRNTQKVLKAGEFTKDYTQNKEVLSKVAKTYSKKIRNIVAGYATKLTKMKKDYE